MIWLPLAGWRRREPTGKTLSQGGDSRSGVLGVTLPPQGIIPEGSPSSRELSLRFYFVAALIHDGRRGWVSQAVKALAASSEPLDPWLVCVLGPLSRAGSARGPYLEHVIRTGVPFAAVQGRRSCSTSPTCNTYSFCCSHPRDTPGDPPVHFGG